MAHGVGLVVLRWGVIWALITFGALLVLMPIRFPAWRCKNPHKRFDRFESALEGGVQQRLTMLASFKSQSELPNQKCTQFGPLIFVQLGYTQQELSHPIVFAIQVGEGNFQHLCQMLSGGDGRFVNAALVTADASACRVFIQANTDAQFILRNAHCQTRDFEAFAKYIAFGFF